MSYWISQVAIFLLIWFVVLFAVLPWGVRQSSAPEPGHDQGAPVNPNLGRKAIITTVISLLLWGVYFFLTQVLGFSLLSLTLPGNQS
jgi:predicted secreted protein